MTKGEARLIREIKKGCTYRRLAEIYYSKDHPGHGNQGWGDELCFKAFSILYPEIKIHPFKIGYNDKTLDIQFRRDNKSYIGDFFWWE